MNEELANPYATPEVHADEPVESEALAGRGRRLFAFWLDGLFNVLLSLPGILLIHDRFFEYVQQSAESTPPPPFFEFFTPQEIVYMYLGTAVLTVLYAYLLTTRGQTLGKLILGIRVVRHDDLSNPGFVRAFLIRYFLHFFVLYQIPILFLGLLYFIVDSLFIFRHDRRTIHDLLAGTTVVNTR